MDLHFSPLSLFVLGTFLGALFGRIFVFGLLAVAFLVQILTKNGVL